MENEIQNQIISARDAPEVHNYRRGITPPEIEEGSFEIKTDYVHMIENRKFNGTALENPYTHLREFERICNLTRIPGVSDNALKLRLFPFSLGEIASEWEYQLAPDSITTWDECKTAFITKFFPTMRTTQLRTSILDFKQNDSENFSDAWERFKKSLLQCPHHRISNDSLLRTFYSGILLQHKKTLDVASKGNFMNQTIEDGWKLVEQLSTSEKGFDMKSSPNTPQIDAHQLEIQELSEKLESLILDSPKHMQSKSNIIGNAHSEEAYYVQSYKAANPPTIKDYYTDPMDITPPPSPPCQPINDMMAMFQNITQGLNANSDALFRFHHDIKKEINYRMDHIHTRLDELENKTLQNAEPITTNLQRKSCDQPQYGYEIDAIGLRSGRLLPPPYPPNIVPVDRTFRREEDEPTSVKTNE